MSTVSVIIPTYNRANLLKEALQSVLNQTYDDFEVLVVDDGSADETAKTVHSLHDDKIRYLHQRNSGRSAARNRGMNEAKGEFICFLDDDDLFFPHKITCQAAYLQTNLDVDMVASGFKTINKLGEVIRTQRFSQVEPELTLVSYLKKPTLITSTILFRRKMLDRLGQWFNSELEPAEDADFFIRLLHAGCRTCFLPEIVSAYRLHGANSSVIGYDRSYRRVLDKLFAQSDIPEEVRAEKIRIYTRYYLVAACRAFACRQVSSAQFKILRGILLDSKALEEELSTTIAQFIGSSKADPQPFVDFMFGNMPAPAAYLKRYQNEALALSRKGMLNRQTAFEQSSFHDTNFFGKEVR